jgi:predicted O-methyltransferase YrrM
MAKVHSLPLMNTEIKIERDQCDIHLFVHREISSQALPRLLAERKAGSFNFIYIDGSHQAPDVHADAVFAFQLAKVGSLIIFDDYLWRE